MSVLWWNSVHNFGQTAFVILKRGMRHGGRQSTVAYGKDFPARKNASEQRTSWFFALKNLWMDIFFCYIVRLFFWGFFVVFFWRGKGPVRASHLAPLGWLGRYISWPLCSVWEQMISQRDCLFRCCSVHGRWIRWPIVSLISQWGRGDSFIQRCLCRVHGAV